jgi:hypothetical protein
MERLKAPREKRKSNRIFMYLPLEYRVKNSLYAHGGHVVDASEGGLSNYSNKDIPVGVKLRLELLFPKIFKSNNFEAEAEIVWKEDRPEGNNGKYAYGMRFTQMSEEAHRKLKQILNGRLQREAKEELSSGFVNIEMRRYPRHAVDLLVECSRINSPISYAGRAINVSEGGLMVYLSEKVEIGQHLKLTLFVGCGSTSDTIDRIAQVVWVEIQSSRAMEFRAGVMIVNTPSKDFLKFEDLS